MEFTRLLERMSIPRDGVLFVHSSFKVFSHEGYDADGVIDALVDYMSAGTLLMPTMSWRYVKPETPFFDELETPSNTGVLTEIFRQKYATRRSLHPTHSVAGCGKLVNELLDGHHLDDTPCSTNSPFGRLSGLNGDVLMLGITMDCCTLVHHVEEMIAPDLYLFGADSRESYTCRDRYAQDHQVGLRRHLFLPRNYWQYQDQLHQKGLLQISLSGSSVCRSFKASDMVRVVTESLNNNPGAIIAQPGHRYRMM